MLPRARLPLLALALALGCAESTAPEASPVRPSLVTNGVPTGSSYGSVGAVLIDVGGDGYIDGFCTGSLIDPTVVLTAAHCFDNPAGTLYYVTFATDFLKFWLADDITPMAGELILATATHASTTDDIGVVLLPEGSTTGMAVYGLPTLGALDALKFGGELSRETAIVVGYGVAGGRGQTIARPFDAVRKVARTKSLTLVSGYYRAADAHGFKDKGGSCFGDSGGPLFLAGQDPTVIFAITTSGVNATCHAVGIYTRLDTESARAFLDDYVDVP